MPGAVGTSMGGPRSSYKWARRRTLPALIRAKDILTAAYRGLYDMPDRVREVCLLVKQDPERLTHRQECMIFAVWQELAEAGALRGIRSKERDDDDEGDCDSDGAGAGRVRE